MRQQIRLQGSGHARIAAYGFADAEARLEKEARRAHPGARLVISAIRQTEGAGRIVGDFEAEYQLHLTLELEAAATGEEELRRSAFRTARDQMIGTRFERVRWDQAVLLTDTEGG